MSTRIKIEKGIPVAPRTGVGAVYPYRDMKHGDSFTVSHKGAIMATQAFRRFKRRHGSRYAIVTRRIPGTEATRCWLLDPALSPRVHIGRKG